MAEVLYISIAGVTTWYSVFFLIPWMAKRSAVYGLHGLRDRLHRVFVANPDLHDSDLFRDLDFLLAHSVHMARDTGYGVFARYVAITLRPSKSTGSMAYAKTFDKLSQTADGREVLGEMLSIFDSQKNWNMLRLLFGHAAVLPVSVLAVLAAFFWVTYRSLSSSVAPEKQLIQGIQRQVGQMDHGSLRLA